MLAVPDTSAQRVTGSETAYGVPYGAGYTISVI